MSKNIRSLITFEIIVHPEDTEIEGNASAIDPETDAKTNQMIRDQLESGNEWAWCCVEVRGEYLGLTASDFLGCCSYKSEADFRHGGYYLDMEKTVTDQIVEQYEKIKND